MIAQSISSPNRPGLPFPLCGVSAVRTTTTVMKMRILPVLLVSSTLLFLAGCEKEDITPVSAAPFDAAEYLRTQVKQPILFQCEYANPGTGERFGWMLDNEGVVRSYDISDNPAAALPWEGMVELEQLTRLSALATEELSRLTAEEVVTHFKRIEGAANGLLSEEVLQPAVEGTLSLVAFHRQTVEYDFSNGCGDNKAGELNPEVRPNFSIAYKEVYQPVVLKVTGAVERENRSQAAKDIAAWLESVEKNLGR
jgi:hypothetical protein